MNAFVSCRTACTAVVLLLGSGCLILNNSGRTRGEVAVGWTFSRGLSCTDAGVIDVVVTLTARSSSAASTGPGTIACEQGSVLIRDVREGDYDLTIEGVTADNIITYAGTTSVVVVAGSRTDVGVLDIPSLLGELTFDWTFEDVGGGAPTPDCAAAGADDVRIILTVRSTGQVLFDDVLLCTEGPATIVDINPDDYLLTVVGQGTYNNLAVPLYRADDLDVPIPGERVTDLGVLVLGADASQFGNMRVGWNFSAGGTCSSRGVTQLQVQIFRGNETTAEDEFTADCTVVNTLRQLFVPGDYLVVATGTGSDGTYSGQVQGNVAPGQTPLFTIPLGRQ